MLALIPIKNLHQQQAVTTKKKTNSAIDSEISCNKIK